MAILQFDVAFRYPTGFQLDFQFTAGPAITGLLGPSGSGKTTTLQLIAGILRPNRGMIRVKDRTLFDSERGQDVPLFRRRIGLVFQEYQLFPHLSVRDNLRFGARRNRRTSIDFSRLVSVLELEPFLDRSPASLSGGQKQRVALGRAIASNPEILLLDEPVSALDEALKESVLDYLSRAIAEYAIPTILVTHDRSTMARLGAEVIPMPRSGSH